LQKTYQQFRRWLAVCLTMLLLVTGLVPAMPASAAGTWTIANPSSIVVDSSETNAFGTFSNPVEVKNRTINGIVLTNTAASGNTVAVAVDGTQVVYNPAPAFVGQTLTLPPITIDRNGAVTKVEVWFGSEKATMYYKLVKQQTGATLQIVPPSDLNQPGKGNSASEALVTNSGKLTNLKIKYNDPGNLDPSPVLEVQLNGKPVQTITAPTAKNNDSEIPVGTIDLKNGINVIKVVAVNTGYESLQYYDYQPQDSPIVLTDYPNEGKNALNPKVYSESKITLRGVYGAGVTGANLRLKIITNNGQTVEDLSSTSPTLSGTNNFTFWDVPLKPGLNVISFYERVGSVTKEHYQFYVQYNNTPYIDSISVNDTPLTSATTLITVASTNRLTLNVDGKVKNAEKVVVKNATTGDEVEARVTSGAFAANLPSQLGENRLEFTVYNDNKKVGVISRTIHVVSRSQDTANQFYNVTIQKQGTSPTPVTNLVLGQVAALPGTGTPNTDKYQISGTALLQFEETDKQTIKQFKLEYKNEKTGGTFSVANITPSSRTYKGSGFTEYAITAPIASGGADTGILEDGVTYRVTLSYEYTTTDPTTGVQTDSGFYQVNGYEYRFTYVDNTKPRFVEAKVGTTKLSEYAVNVLGNATFTVDMTTENMSGDPNHYTVTYNGSKINYIYDPDKDIVDKDKQFKFALSNMPAGTGDLEIRYNDGVNPPLSVTYKLNIQIAPYLQLTYIDGSGQVRSFESGYQIKSDDDFVSLSGKVYNYDLTSSNIVVKLNGTPITPTLGTNNSFTISKASLQDNIKSKGEHTLEITLTTEPSVSFTYKILFITSKAPTIEDVKLKISENGKDNELVKQPTDTAYRTGAKFLSEFSFTVKDAEHVYIEKNGKRIADFRYENGDWEQKEDNQDYNDTLNQIPSGLRRDFQEYNFDAESKTSFRAKMRSSDYGDLLEQIQDEVSKSDEQEQKLALFPLTLKKNGTTTYTIVAEDGNGAVVRYEVKIDQTTNSWEIISPVKAKESDPYIVVNANSVPIKVFAENATKVMFGKTEAKVTNTTQRDFEYNEDLGKPVPKSYYVFTATVPLKAGLNKIKYTVFVGSTSYNDEVQIFNANSSVNGAEYRDVLGKKTSFSVFDKKLELKFPTGTVLVSPPNKLEGEEVTNPTKDIFVDVELYFGIADRTTGQVAIPDDDMKSKLTLNENFNYASPLYYIDAGDKNAPGGRDPYYSDGDDIDTFKDRYEDNLVPSKPGTLTIQYDPSIVNAANNILTVYYHNGDEWQNLGGVVNTSKKTIMVPFAGFGYYMVMKTKESFDDVVNHDFARDAMETLYAKGIMPNYSAISFGANRDITRGEFATMLVKALDLPINDGPYVDSRTPSAPTFNDVRPVRDTWDYQYKYIETAARAGIVRGKEPGYFRPDDPLTREEAAIMIARALNLKLGTPDAAKVALAKMFTDAKDVGYYAQPAVLAVAKAKIMAGEPNDPAAKKPTYRFLPKSNLTRAEMAVITIRVMVQLKKLPKQ
jgi:hypothetical protein